MPKVHCHVPDDFKKMIREDKSELNPYVTFVVSENREEYDKFAGRMNNITEWLPEHPSSSIYDLYEMLFSCVHDESSEEYMKEVEGYYHDEDFHQKMLTQAAKNGNIKDVEKLELCKMTLDDFMLENGENIKDSFRDVGKFIYLKQARFDSEFVYNIYNLIANQFDGAFHPILGLVICFAGSHWRSRRAFQPSSSYFVSLSFPYNR